MRDLQENSAEGVVDFRAVQTDENSFEIEADGHATRYYAIIIKHKLYGLPINRPSAEWPIRRCAM
jgi:hypothetical protein